jgi:hypothetical protein
LTKSQNQMVAPLNLTKAENDEIDFIDADIERIIDQFIDIGTHFKRINDTGWWARDCGSFRDFVGRHGFSTTRAYQLIAAAETRANLSTQCQVVPAIESHYEPLAKIKDPAKQISTWAAILKKCDKLGIQPTAKLITEAVALVLTPRAKADTTVVDDPPADAIDVTTTGQTTGQTVQNSGQSDDESIANTSLQTGTASDIEAQFHLPAGTLTEPAAQPPSDDPTADEGDQPHVNDDDVVLSRKAIRGLIKHVMPKISEHAHVVDRVLRAIGKPGIDLEAMGEHQDAIIAAFEAAKRDLQ